MNCFNKILALISITLIPSILIGQVEINKPIVFISPDDSLRQIENLGGVTSMNDLINAEEVVSNKKLYAEAYISGDTLVADFQISVTNYSKGLKLFVQFPDTQITQVKFIKCDDLPPTPIYIHGHLEPLKNSIKSGEILVFIFDGDFFQVLKRKEKSCPDGFVQVNTSYCILQDIGIEGTFEDAYNFCQSFGARICTWAEWHYACRNSQAFNLSNMTTAHQWTDSGAVVEDGVKVAGLNSCFSHGVTRYYNNAFSRCCYDK